MNNNDWKKIEETFKKLDKIFAEVDMNLNEIDKKIKKAQWIKMVGHCSFVRSIRFVRSCQNE